MKTNISNFLAVVCACILSVMLSCSNEVDFGEQYQKTLYIVNSTDLLFTGEHYFETRNDAIVISVYCASSKPITSDLQARLVINRPAMDSLNTLQTMIDPSYVHKQMLSPSYYEVNGELYVTIKAGSQYGTLSIPFNFGDLDPDIAYTLPVSLVSNNADYEINQELRSIVYEIKMMNQYAGNFAGSSQESLTEIRGVQPVLKALSANTVRLPIHNLSTNNLNANFMVLTIAGNGSVTISPWADAQVTDLGDSFYDAESQTFELNYEFTNAAGVTFTISEIITRI